MTVLLLLGIRSPAFALQRGALSLDECAAHRQEAEKDARIHPGYAVYSKGLSRLLGWCDPEDADLGRAEIERAIAMDFDGVLVVDYVTALLTVEDRARAEVWLDAAAASILHHPFRTGRSFPASVEIPQPLVRRVQALISSESGDTAALASVASRFLNSPVRAPRAESWYLDHALSALMLTDPKEGGYLRAMAGLAGRLSDNADTIIDYHLSGATACGHPQATRRLAMRILSGDALRLDPARVAAMLLRLPDASENDAATAFAVLERAGEPLSAFRSTERQSALKAADSEDCWAYTAGRLGRPPR